MSETVLILRASKWEMTDERTGEIRKGCTLHFVNQSQVETANAVGDAPMKIQATDEVFVEVKKHKAPGFFDMSTRTKPGKEGQATVMATKAKFIQSFSFPLDE